jgi:hypothetical protein
VYEKRTNQIIVDIDGREFIIRNSEDDNGCEYFVYSETLTDNWIDPNVLEDSELKDVLINLANAAYDDFIFGESRVGKEVDLEELQDY